MNSDAHQSSRQLMTPHCSAGAVCNTQLTSYVAGCDTIRFRLTWNPTNHLFRGISFLCDPFLGFMLIWGDLSKLIHSRSKPFQQLGAHFEPPVEPNFWFDDLCEWGRGCGVSSVLRSADALFSELSTVPSPHRFLFLKGHWACTPHRTHDPQVQQCDSVSHMVVEDGVLEPHDTKRVPVYMRKQ